MTAAWQVAWQLHQLWFNRAVLLIKIMLLMLAVGAVCNAWVTYATTAR